MNYSTEQIQELIDYFGKENLPNPEQYPIRFEFLIKSFQHYKNTRGKDLHETE